MVTVLVQPLALKVMLRQVSLQDQYTIQYNVEKGKTAKKNNKCTHSKQTTWLNVKSNSSTGGVMFEMSDYHH